MMTPQQIKAERERIQREIEFYRAANRWFEQRRKERHGTARVRNE